jgi:methionyl-tRNA formyltransferase
MPQAPPAPWRVVILTSISPVAIGYAALTRACGHEPVAVITPRRSVSDEFFVEGTAGMDVAVAATKKSLAPLLTAYRADLGLCTGFPWLVPKEALAAPTIGIVNGHPSLLPRYRGPFPISWAARNGETEIGLTYHFMDAEFDTGNVLAQKSIPFVEGETDETLIPKLEAASRELLPQVFARVARGDAGDPQEGGEYLHGFEPEYVGLDTTRTAAEVHRQVWAWSFMPAFVEDRGAILDRDGTRRRIRRTSLVEVEGAERLECADAPLWILDSETA